jgi:creatinine amidohydrolase/Fe(II)-dependent formamide hydrolase-like protein
MRLKKIKHTDFNKNIKYDFLIPIGATEQHGPFLPFGVDTYITDYLVQQSEKHFPELIVLPTLEFSRSQEHRGFYGTVWLSEETLARVMFDICNSLFSQANKIIFVTFHANENVIDNFIATNQTHFSPAQLARVEIWNKEDDKNMMKILSGEIDDHAGNTEISSMLFLEEKLVIIPDKIHEKKYIENPFDNDDLASKSANGIADNHPKWVVSKDIGEKVLEIYSKRVISHLEILLLKK